MEHEVYDRNKKPNEPFMVIDFKDTRCKTFKTLEDADIFAMEYSKKCESLIIVTEAVKLIDGYRCVVRSGYRCGLYVGTVVNEIMVHYAFYYLGGRIIE